MVTETVVDKHLRLSEQSWQLTQRYARLDGRSVVDEVTHILESVVIVAYPEINYQFLVEPAVVKGILNRDVKFVLPETVYDQYERMAQARSIPETTLMRHALWTGLQVRKRLGNTPRQMTKEEFARHIARR